MYERQNFVKGQKLKADQLNHMEDGIVSAVSVNNQDLTPQQQAQARGNIGAVSNEQLEEVKTSVSEGKALVAAAVTGKGVETAANATFATIAANIESIEASGGDIDALIEGSITEIERNSTSVRDYAFYQCDALTSARFPLAASIGTSAFYGCENLVEALFPFAKNIPGNCFQLCSALSAVDFPSATTVSSNSFKQCTALQNVSLPLATAIQTNTFNLCTNLLMADFGAASSIASYAFTGCYNLKHLILRLNGVVSLSATTAFTNCYWLAGTVNTTHNPNGEQGYVYIPRAYVDSYPSATNWSSLGFQYRALEDYTVDGTITGELDMNKINGAGGGSGGGSGDIM